MRETRFALGQDNSGGNSTDSITKNYTAGENLAAQRVVYFDQLTNKVFHADSSISSLAAKVVGITKQAVVTNTLVEVIELGLYTDNSFNFVNEKLVFLGSNGVLTQTTPTSGFRQVVATTRENNYIFVKIERPVLL